MIYFESLKYMSIQKSPRNVYNVIIIAQTGKNQESRQNCPTDHRFPRPDLSHKHIWGPKMKCVCGTQIFGNNKKLLNMQ